MTLTTVDQTPCIGTEVKTDIDTILSGAIAGDLRRLLVERGVVFIRGIELDDQQLFDFSRTMGTVEEADGTLMKVTFDEKESGIYARYFPGTFYWHMDRTFDVLPPFATIVTARVLSPTGGETEFANTYAAYEALPPSEKDYLDTLTVIHTMESAMRCGISDPTEEELANWNTYPVRAHPLVWHHRSGRKSLALSTSGTQVLNLSKKESDALLKRLTDWATQPQFVYQHKWQLNDVLMWDNTGTMHRALPYDRTSGRRLHRYTLVGEEPVTPVKMHQPLAASA